MRKVEIILSAGTIDLFGNDSLSLNYSVYDVRDITKRNTTYSKTLTIPGTKTNNDIFGSIFEISVDSSGTRHFQPNKKERCQILADTIPVMDGYLQLKKINILKQNQISYEVVCFGDNINLVKEIGDKYLTDLYSFSAFTHTRNLTNIEASWIAPAGNGYVYGLIDYGYDWSKNNIDGTNDTIKINQVFASTYAKGMFDQIIHDAGYTYYGTTPNSNAFKHIVIPSNSYPQFDAQVNLNYVVFPSVNNLDSYFNVQVVRINAPGAASQTETVLLMFGEVIKSAQTAYNRIGKVKLSEGDVIAVKFNSAPDLTGGTYDFTVDPVYTSIEVIYDEQVNGNFKATLTTGGGITVPSAGSAYIIYNDDSTGSNYDQGGTFNITTGRHTAPAIPYKKYLPVNTKQIDLFTSICKKFNLYIEPSKTNPKNLFIETRDLYYTSGVTYDWTSKLATDKPFIVQILSEINDKEILLTDKLDEDFLNKTYNNTNKEIYGQKLNVIDNDFLEVNSQTKIETIFSPTPMASILGANDIVVPQIYDKDEDTNKLKSFASNIRLLYYGGLLPTNTTWKINDPNVPTTHPYTSYPYVGHLDNPFASTFDLNFGQCKQYFFANSGITDNNLFNQYYKNFINELTNSKLVTAYFHLTPHDISQLTFHDQIFCDGIYYKVNRIIDYNPINSDLTKVELLVSIDPVTFRPATKQVVTSRIDTVTDTVDSGIGNEFRVMNGGIIGTNNTIGERADNSLIAGQQNITNARNTVILATTGSSIDVNSYNSMILGGSDNHIGTGVTGTVILGGDGITANTSNTTYMQGINIYNIDVTNFFSAGTYSIWTGNTGAGIKTIYPLNASHILEDQATYSNINGGFNNQIYSPLGVTETNVIAGGYKGQIHDSNSAFIGGGAFAYLSGTSQSSIVNGNNNRTISADYSDILNGQANRINNAHYSTIVNGQNNYISADTYSVTMGITNAAIIGASNITADTSNTTYMDFVKARSLTGGTTQMVVADASGNLSVQAIPSSGTSSTATSVQPGVNTYTAGTASNPSVNVSALTVNTISASGNSIFSGNLSATTIYSGSTNIGNLFGEKNTASNLAGGTGVFAQKSGVDLQFKSISGGSNITITSDANVVAIASTGGSATSVQPGVNTYTGGTASNPSVNVSALTINTLSASGNSIFSGNLSATTIFSGGTDLSILITRPIIVSGTSISGGSSNRILFHSTANTISESNNLYWDDNYQYMGLGLNNPQHMFQNTSQSVFDIGEGFNTPFLSAGITQNLLLRSEDFTATWVTTSATTTADVILDPVNAVTADRLSGNSVGSLVKQTVNTTVTGLTTFSVWLKATGATVGQNITLQINSTGETGSQKTITLSSNWQRYAVTQNFVLATNQKIAIINIGNNANVFAWGACLNEWGYASPYFKTVGSAFAKSSEVTMRTAGSSTQAFAINSSGNLTIGNNITSGGDVTVNGAVGVTCNGLTENNGSITANLDPGVISTPAIYLNEPNNASGGAPVKYSPGLRWLANAHTGSLSQYCAFDMEVRPVNGTNPITGALYLFGNLNGTLMGELMTVDNFGVVKIKAGQSAATSVNCIVGGKIGFNASTTGSTGTAETDLHSYTITGNTLWKNGQDIEFKFAGQFAATVANKDIRVYYSGVSIFDTGSVAFNSGDWEVEGVIMRNTPTSVRCSVKFNTSNATLSSYSKYTSITGLTLTSNGTLKATGQAGVGGADNDIICTMSKVIFEG